MKLPTKQELVSARIKCLALKEVIGLDKVYSDVRTAGIVIVVESVEYYFPKEVNLTSLLVEVKAILGNLVVAIPTRIPKKTPVQVALF